MSRPIPRPKGLDAPRAVKIIRAMSAANVWMYKRTGGRLGGKWRVMSGFRRPVNVLLLSVTGRKSGIRRTVPLLHLADGDDHIVVASTGGLPGDPQWLLNLVATPDVEVQIGRRVTPMTAIVVGSDERAALWPRLVAMYADFDTYAGWTDREIQVIRLSPRG